MVMSVAEWRLAHPEKWQRACENPAGDAVENRCQSANEARPIRLPFLARDSPHGGAATRLWLSRLISAVVRVCPGFGCHLTCEDSFSLEGCQSWRRHTRESSATMSWPWP